MPGRRNRCQNSKTKPVYGEKRKSPAPAISARAPF
jgi:hypothetical protein